MSDHIRYAIYYLPPAGPLADFGAAWLGWDVARGAPAEQPAVEGLRAATGTPRKYGFHGTLKPPFRLAEGRDAAGLHTATERLAAAVAPVTLDGLVLGGLGHFLALVPQGDAPALAELAGRCVADLDAFRAPPPAAELDRRRAAGLTAPQEAHLTRWGYPYVFDQFRFHMTLTGGLDPQGLQRFRQEIALRLPSLPAPYVIDSIALAGQRADGMFETIHRYALTG